MLTSTATGWCVSDPVRMQLRIPFCPCVNTARRGGVAFRLESITRRALRTFSCNSGMCTHLSTGAWLGACDSAGVRARRERSQRLHARRSQAQAGAGGEDAHGAKRCRAQLPPKSRPLLVPHLASACDACAECVVVDHLQHSASTPHAYETL